ncbi:MAG: acetyl-CoA decarbonylase/synthase complex subunit gamma [Syntrophus sp. PtaB.Bin001]|nr:MAG: acetyl-CoA decarbonylase/synthase complex subunit gamma [Syntrophus sp. PtaB.Bin001]
MPQIAATLTLSDRLGTWKARWGIGRMNYMVPPGLYAIGTPTPDDPVLVTANYKMSYDIIRSVLTGRNAWLLVLETYGINVWCAAGKGTFGTEELVRRIRTSNLAKAVSHRRLILPILGAPGVAAYEVTRQTGFSIRYAAIRAGDIPKYLDNSMMTTAEMREQTFTLRERAVLIPVELVMALKPTAIVTAALFALGAMLYGIQIGLITVFAYLGAVISGIALAPLLLPWLPGRSFAFKGALIGLAWIAAFYLLTPGQWWNGPVAVATFVALPAVSAFYTLNFTGCTPFTSRSGVKKEMRVAIPAMGIALIASVFILAIGKLL